MTQIAQCRRDWRAALFSAIPVSLLILLLFYYWFGIADRYSIFLYYHDMGPVVPDTSPFSPVTSSRYWMAGLVASGAILVLYGAANWLLGRLVADYQPPAWWLIWMLSIVPLMIGIPAITMAVNDPKLPLVNALQATLSILVGLALALLPGEMAARRPGELLWLILDGVGVMLLLLTLAGLQNLPRWWINGGHWWTLMLVAALVAAAVWLLSVTALRTLFRIPVTSAAMLFLAGLCMAYVLMPLVHHVLGTDGQFYITNSNNFFADNVALQIAIWLLVAGLVWGLTRLRQSLAVWRTTASTSAV
jgi:hypothetical protein